MYGIKDIEFAGASSPETILGTEKYANNRAELSHQPTRVRKRGMRMFKSVRQAQRSLNTYAEVYNVFNLCRHFGLWKLVDISDCVHLCLGKMRG